MSTERPPEKLIRAWWRSLSDFGYNVGLERVEGMVAELIDGQTPKGGPQMFLDTWVQEWKDGQPHE